MHRDFINIMLEEYPCEIRSFPDCRTCANCRAPLPRKPLSPSSAFLSGPLPDLNSTSFSLNQLHRQPRLVDT